MSSTSKQVDDANKLAAAIEAGEFKAPESPKVDEHGNTEDKSKGIDKNATIGGLNRENFKPVADGNVISAPISELRESSKPIGLEKQHKLADQFKPEDSRAEAQTAVKKSQMTTAEKNTQVSDKQNEAEKRIQKNEIGVVSGDKEADKTTAAKQTKVTEDQKKKENLKQEKNDKHEKNVSKTEKNEPKKAAVVEKKKEEPKKVTVVEKKKEEPKKAAVVVEQKKEVSTTKPEKK